MDQIKNLLPKAVEILAHPTKVNLSSTKALDKFISFQALNDPQLERMKAEAVSFLGDVMNGRAPRWLSFLGTSGSGKTMLARIISKTVRRRLSGGFITWNTLSTWVRDGEYRMFNDVAHDQFVALDDIGSEYATDFTRAKLFEFLSARQRKWTVLTANLSLNQIGSTLDTRIASRMIRDGGVVVDVDVPDYNLRSSSLLQ